MGDNMFVDSLDYKALKIELEAAQRERDRYKAALERIEDASRGGKCDHACVLSGKIAKEILAEAVRP